MNTIAAVDSKAALKNFIEFPWKVYRGDPNWVPPLISDVEFILGKENPFWEHAEKQLFVALDGSGKPAGRIAGVIDRRYEEFHGEKLGFFGFYESVNEADVARKLYGAVRDWLKAKGVTRMIGPVNPSTNDESGFLCENFSEPPRIMMPYNPPYYLDLAENCGLKKAKELYAYDMDVSPAVIGRLERIARLTYRKNPDLKVRKFDLANDFETEVQKALSVYNSAWEKNWGFVPWTEKEFRTIVVRIKDLVVPDVALLAEIAGRPVGMLVAIPDYNHILKRINGRMSPLGLLKFLYYRNKISALRLMIMGVVKECRQRGIEGVLYYESLKNTLHLGFKKCEFSWVLEDNIMTQRAAEMMGGKLYKKYRIYES